MLANKSFIRSATSVISANRIYCPKLKSMISQQKLTRNIHILHRQTSSPGLGFGGTGNKLFFNLQKHNRTSAFVIIIRNESSTTQIPPLTSEVFSRQIEQSTTTISPTVSIEAHSTTTPLPVNSTSLQGESNLSIESSHAKIETTTSVTEPLVWIPEPPSIPNPVEELALNALGEPTFESLGLGSWWPPGIVQQCLELAHVNLGLPWWGAILLGTACVRLLVFPLVIKSQRNAAKMTNNMPQMQAIQLKMSEARQTGNALGAAKYGQDLMLFMKEKDISPLRSVLVPFAMAPIFISFFFGLRKMANLPVESMKEGGLWWFTDLTMADPYCLLPLLTSVTLWITMEVGVDGVQLNASQHGNTMRYFMRAIPVIMFPLTMNFPAAILCYWVSTNAISLVQVSFLKHPAIRAKLGIEQLRKINPATLPIQKKGFRESLTDSWKNVKISKEIEERARYDEITFKRAGRAPIPKTYKYDPTKVDPNAMQAKQKR